MHKGTVRKAALIVASLIITSGSISYSQTTREMQYLMGKKELGAGLVLALMFPGAGHIYAENDIAAGAYIGSEFACVIWYVLGVRRAEAEITHDIRGNVIGHGEYSRTPLWIFLALRIVDIATTPGAVDDYNSALFKRIGLTMKSGGMTLRLYF